MENIKVSVIVPFFNVAYYVERCVRSLLEQTLQDVEFIFIDDASTDSSRVIVEKVVAQYDRKVRIVTHTHNKGLPSARNTGLSYAVGEYILHCDSDDWLEPTMLQDMYKAAITKDSDYVYCDFYIDFEYSRRYIATLDYQTPEQMLKEGLLSGAMKYNVWNKLVKRSLYEADNSIRFPDGHPMGEDMTMILLCTHAHNVTRVPKALYHYMKTNGNAYTRTQSKRHFDDIHYNAERTISYLNTLYDPELKKYIMFFKLSIKLPMLFSGSYKQFCLWKQWYPETGPYIKQNTFLPRRTIVIQLMALHGLYPVVWFYCFLVNNVYYRLPQRDK